VRSSGFKPKTLSFHPTVTGEGKIGREKSSEPLVDASSSRAPHGWMVVAGCRDMALRTRRTLAGERLRSRVSTVVPGVERAPTPIAARACETRKLRPGPTPLEGWVSRP
jgi:hypothetical protein